MAYPVWVVAVKRDRDVAWDAVNGPWLNVVGIFPIHRREQANDMAFKCHAQVHPGAISEGVTFNTEVTVP